ncbi:MAG: superinfection immunity protein [Alphaproteobacteria bacterium]
MTPTYLAIINNSSKYDRMRVRVGSWMFGWTFVGWLFALFVSAKK